MSTGTPMAKFRLATGLWERFRDAAREAGTNRTTVLREFILWYLHYPGAELPERPDVQDQTQIDKR